MRTTHFLFILDQFSLLCITAALVFLHLSYNHQPNVNYFKKIFLSWNKTTYLDLKALTNGKCDDNYTLFEWDIWPGLLSGCYCLSSDVVLHDCPIGCNSVDKIKPLPYIKWNSNSICVNKLNRRYRDNNFLVEKDGKCPPIMKPCGLFDSLGNILCVEINELCPINDIGFFDSSDISSKNYHSIIFNNKELRFTNKKNNSWVLTGFKISENHPCIDPAFENKVSKSYPLDFYVNRDKCMNNFNGKILDPDYVYFDTGFRLNLYNDNKISSEISNMPKLNVLDLNNSINIYAHYGYIGINKSCYENIMKGNTSIILMQALYNIGEFIQNNDLIKNGLCFIYPMIIFHLFLYKIELCTYFYKEPQPIKKKTIAVVISFICLSIALVLISIYFDSLKKLNENFKFVKSYLNCGDTLLINEISYLNIEKLFNYSLIVLVCLIFTTMYFKYNLMIIILFIKKEKPKKMISTNSKKNNKDIINNPFKNTIKEYRKETNNRLQNAFSRGYISVNEIELKLKFPNLKIEDKINVNSSF